MTCVQITALFNYHLLSYLQNHFEQVYLTAIMGTSSDFFTIFAAGCLLEKLGVKTSLVFCYITAAFGGILMLAYGLDHTDSIAFPIFFLICRAGVRGADLIFVAANSRVFDIEQASTAFGLGAFFGRMGLSAAPVVSTIAQPVPMVIFTATTIVSSTTAFCLMIHPQAETFNRKKIVDHNEEGKD